MADVWGDVSAGAVSWALTFLNDFGIPVAIVAGLGVVATVVTILRRAQ